MRYRRRTEDIWKEISSSKIAELRSTIAEYIDNDENSGETIKYICIGVAAFYILDLLGE